MCAPSCHDCSTLRAWWEEDEERRRRYFKTVVGSDMLPPSTCVPDVAYFVIKQHFEAPSMWAIFPLQVSRWTNLCSFPSSYMALRLRMLFVHNCSTFVLIPFHVQDLLALKDKYTTRPATEETINDPTNPKHYWRYRMYRLLFFKLI